MVVRILCSLIFIFLSISSAWALDAPDPVPQGLLGQLEYQEMLFVYDKLRDEKAKIEHQIGTHNRMCKAIDPMDLELLVKCQTKVAPLQKAKHNYKNALKSYNERLECATQRAIQNQIKSFRTIEVPPPIPPEEVSIMFGEIPSDDKTSAGVLLGTTAGLAVLDVIGKISEKTMFGVKVILVTGKAFIAAEDGADIYITRKNKTYEDALKYLKQPETSQQFTAIVQALKKGEPLSEDVSIDIVRAAQAILDPKLGSTGRRMAWSAMLSPEAKNAALTKLTLEAYSLFFGAIAKKTVARVMTVRDPAYQKASYHLDKFAKVLPQLKNNPEAKKSVLEAIDLSNKKIADIYTTYIKDSAIPKGIGHANYFYRGYQFKKALKEWRKSKKVMENM